MAHEFLIKDIAFQAGLSAATVDRVVNERGGVRRQTRARVDAAIEELRNQERNAALKGRTYVFDIVMETPERFSRAVRASFETAAATFPPATLRCRFHVAEQFDEPDLIAILTSIRRRGSHGVVLKAPDTAAIAGAVAQLADGSIPVCTFVTDVPQSRRIAYAGADNHAAGQTAAYLIGSQLRQGAVIVTLSSSRFQGEEERRTGFRSLLAERWPHLRVLEISGGYGRDKQTGDDVRAVLAAHADINAVYSIGGGNRAVIDAFREARRPLDCFVAHDLDRDNIALLQREELNFVLHHDLNADADTVYRAFLRYHHAIPQEAGPRISALDIITPFNVSSRASAYPRS